METLQEEIKRIMGLFSEAEKGVLREHLFQVIPATHGLAGFLDLELLHKRHGFQLEFFLFTSWALLGREQIEAAERSAQGWSCSESEEEWVKAAHWGIAFVVYLEMAHPWLCNEIDAMLEDLESDLLLCTTCAPKQLLFQWFCETYRRTLVGLAAAGDCCESAAKLVAAAATAMAVARAPSQTNRAGIAAIRS